MIHKEDISFTNEILSSINDPRKSLLIVDVYRLAQNEAQADRVMNTLSNMRPLANLIWH